MIQVLANTVLLLLVASVGASLVFVLRYLPTEWRKTVEGRGMLAFAVIIFVVLATTLYGYFFGALTVGWLLVQVIEFLALFIALVGLDVLLFQAQGRKKRRKQAERVAAAAVADSATKQGDDHV